MTVHDRIRALTDGVTTRRPLEEVARESGLPLQELEAWSRVYEAARQEHARRRRALLARLGAALAVALAVTVGTLGTEAWAGTCTAVLPSPLKTFCANEPALAGEINSNFQQLYDWMNQKVGTPGNANVTIKGTLTLASPDGGAGSLAINGSSAFSGALSVDGGLFFGNSTRQMVNLWGSTYGIGVQDGTTYFRSGQNFAWYRNGSHSNTTFDPGPGGATSMRLNGNGELTANGLFQNDTAPPTPYEVSLTNFVVEASVARVGMVVPINQAALDALCRDADGCHYTLAMVNFAGDGTVASRSGVLFLTEGGNTWRFETGDISGTDANGTPSEVSAWDCIFTDAETMTDTNNGRQDNTAGFGLLNCKGCTYSDTLTRCRMVFRD